MVQAWYAGQEQGNAIARVLFGDVNPSGKLPLTFPRSEEDTPVATPEQYPGVDGAVHYSEGIFVGYRGYERLGILPQYPFGHGLSYTSFDYTNLTATVSGRHQDGDLAVQVRCEVSNTGDRPGKDDKTVAYAEDRVLGSNHVAAKQHRALKRAAPKLCAISLR